MKRSAIVMIGVAALVMAGGGFVLQSQAAKAGSLAAGGEGFHGLLGRRIAEKLNLSDDQIAQMKKVRNEEKDVVLAKLSVLHNARVEMRKVIEQPINGKADEKAV